jgi:hypothetical protein
MMRTGFVGKFFTASAAYAAPFSIVTASIEITNFMIAPRI